MCKRLAPLDVLDTIDGTVARDARQLRLHMLRFSLWRMPIY